MSDLISDPPVKAHEHRCVVVHHYKPGHSSHPNDGHCRCGCGASRQRSEPMPEWSDTDGTFKCPQCGAGWPHYHNEAGEPRELPPSSSAPPATPNLGSPSSSLGVPVQEEATLTLDAEKIDGLIRGVLWAMDLVERGPAFNGSRYEVDRSRLTAARNGLVDIRALLQKSLAGSISERETLTAQWEAGFVARCTYGRVAYLLTGAEDGTPIDHDAVLKAAMRLSERR